MTTPAEWKQLEEFLERCAGVDEPAEEPFEMPEDENEVEP